MPLDLPPAPSIDPVPAPRRPRWSVMIPAHQAERWLPHALESVLAQELPTDTQVEVVDDCSSDATADVARGFSDHGVVVRRNPVRLGAVGNFNACLRQARGHYVHLLHADDFVEPGFHHRLGDALDRGMVFATCRSRYVDDSGRSRTVTRSEAPTGPWHTARSTLAISNRVRPSAMVFRRDAVEAVGGFRAELGHAADWEFWARLVAHGPGWFEDEVLAAYRVHDDNDTLRWRRRADNVRRRVGVLGRVAELLEPDRARRRVRQGLAYGAVFAGRVALRYVRRQQWHAARAQAGAGLACLAGAVVSPSVADRLLAVES